MTSDVTDDLVMRSIPPRQVLADEVYSRLRSLIMESSIPPGTRINIEEVARRLDVSPTPVRESLARLESDGLVDKLPLKGYRTTELLDRDEVRELYELRLLIEPHSAAQAARKITPQATAELLAELATCQVSTDDSGNASYQELSNHDVRLHDLILAFAGNETIRQAYARTHCHLHTFRLAYSGTFGNHTLEEHSAVVDAIVAGDAVRAEDAMRTHIEQSRDRILARFELNATARG
jgi:DNA-binding GntR family transcriptional regulator